MFPGSPIPSELFKTSESNHDLIKLIVLFTFLGKVSGGLLTKQSETIKSEGKEEVNGQKKQTMVWLRRPQSSNENSWAGN